MNLLKIDPQQTTFWTETPFEEGFQIVWMCEKTEHEYDDDREFDSTEYGGSFQCIHCRAILTYDVSDMGD